MLKTLTPVAPELIRLCNDKSWIAVVNRCKSHPDEARPTPAALQGSGTTALGIAVRSRAPTEVIQALIDANTHQLSVVHEFSGSILHEALAQRSPYKVLSCLFEAVVHHERVHNHDRDESYVSVIRRKGPLHRTLLHYLAIRVLLEASNDGDHSEMFALFRSIVLAYPKELVEAEDDDGNTPLVLVLVRPTIGDSHHSDKVEEYSFRMVQLMVTSCSSVVKLATRIRGKKYFDCWRRQQPGRLDEDFPRTIENRAPTPLAYAIVFGRSESTIQLLLEAHRKIGINPCLTPASKYRELPLHVAANVRSPMPLLQDLLEYEPSAVRARDINNLTPVDWLWIRHVVDWCHSSRVMPSTRRYISPHFAAWHEHTSKTIQQPTDSESQTTLIESLLQRMELLLPVAANAVTRKSTINNESKSERDEQAAASWSLLHSACFISCPIAVVRLALCQDTNGVRVKESSTGRLPLHCAAARTGYTLTIPVGVSREERTLSEPSPAPEVASKFVQATRVADVRNQLPLHIAIDTAKRSSNNESEDVGDTVVSELVRLYPESLDRRDGVTKLYPFLQAAAGPDALLGTTFMLLVKYPTLVSSASDFTN